MRLSYRKKKKKHKSHVMLDWGLIDSHHWASAVASVAASLSLSSLSSGSTPISSLPCLPYLPLSLLLSLALSHLSHLSHLSVSLYLALPLSLSPSRSPSLCLPVKTEMIGQGHWIPGSKHLQTPTSQEETEVCSTFLSKDRFMIFMGSLW